MVRHGSTGEFLHPGDEVKDRETIEQPIGEERRGLFNARPFPPTAVQGWQRLVDEREQFVAEMRISRWIHARCQFVWMRWRTVLRTIGSHAGAVAMLVS